MENNGRVSLDGQEDGRVGKKKGRGGITNTKDVGQINMETYYFITS